MKVEFADSKLEKLYYEGKGAKNYPDNIIKSFFKKIQLIKSANNENDLRALKSNHFEKIKGKKNLYSIRLNIAYRLEFSIEKNNECKIILIIKISNHYD